MGAVELRNIKDFLQTYNSVAEYCFSKCINNLNSRQLGKDEEACADRCAQKFLNVNHRMMKVYMVVQQDMMNRKISEAALAAAEEAALAQSEQTNQIIEN